MRALIMLILLATLQQSIYAQFEHYPAYTGNDLGLRYTKQRSQFRIWAPTAEKARLLLFEKAGSTARFVDMQKSVAGTWVVNVTKDIAGAEYQFQVMYNKNWSKAVTDPYVTAVTANGERGVVLDLRQTDPQGWKEDRSPVFRHKTDAIIYELHVRDASIAANSGIRQKGKFLGLTETGTRNPAGQSTGIDHIAELGVTHVHLLPSFDFNSVDEKNPAASYNWGYDPLHYNVPEGSYSTDAMNPSSRIREFKQLVQSFHKRGLRVVMDVVYNHTALSETSNFNILVPGYYYRQDAAGKFSNATACGNETASERAMFRKFMLESMLYWVKEYHVDGFRIDLMGVHDIETMNRISGELHRLRPDILLYGEGWTAGASPLPDSLRALKANAARLDRIAVFSDDIRDGIKGSVFDHADRGFVSGKAGMEESIRFGIVAAVPHQQLDYSKVNYSKGPYARHPWHTVSYAECHDNHVLWDKLAISASGVPEADREKMHRLALTIVLTSQGISFLHAGTEFLRTKNGEENSYKSPDAVNQIDWDLKSKNARHYDYTRALIALRRAHPAFRLTTGQDVRRHLSFLPSSPGVVAYSLNGAGAGDSWKTIVVVHNANSVSTVFPLQGSDWKIGWNEAGPAAMPLTTATVDVAPYSSIILYR